MQKTMARLISNAVFILFALSILLALSSKKSNNLFPSAQSVPSGLRADGDPAPPFPKPLPPLPPAVMHMNQSIVVADGDPAPPFPKPLPPLPPEVMYMNESMFVADGDPAPPFPKPPVGSNSGVRQLRHDSAGEDQLASV